MIGPEEPPRLGKRKRDDEHHQGEKEGEQKQPRPDFARLAGKYDYFARHAMKTKKNKSEEEGVFIDFTSWQATHDLCRALLEEIGVKNWSIPKGHLVPGFTQRRNYCEWVESLLEKDGVCTEEENVRGVDVGTGASAIFALLFTSRHPKWDMFGTDITEEAVESARRNCLAAGASECCFKDDETTEQVAAADNNNTHSNCSSGRSRRWISIRDVAKKRSSSVTREEEAEEAEEEEDQPILDLDLFEEERIDFTVCNPPFFNNMSESSQNPRTNFGGTAKENSYRGGESSFVRRMILESRRVALSLNSSTDSKSAPARKSGKGEEGQHRVRWFTTMVGAKATLKMAKKCLREMKETTKLRETAFVQGKTRRWGLAWSFL